MQNVEILLLIVFILISLEQSTVYCQEFYLGNLTDASKAELYNDLNSDVLAIQYHVAIGNRTTLVYITSNIRLLTLSPERRFYTFGTIHSGFKFSVRIKFIL
jgi:hypothetical protein